MGTDTKMSQPESYSTLGDRINKTNELLEEMLIEPRERRLNAMSINEHSQELANKIRKSLTPERIAKAKETLAKKNREVFNALTNTQPKIDVDEIYKRQKKERMKVAEGLLK